MTSPNSKRLLEASGRIADWQVSACETINILPGETLPSGLSEATLLADTILVEFAASSDGRGFSMAPLLRNRGYAGRLVATGQIIPDQVSMAFQCGYDAVLVSGKQLEQYGEDAWLSALEPIVDLAYPSSKSAKIRSIWQERHLASLTRGAR